MNSRACMQRLGRTAAVVSLTLLLAGAGAARTFSLAGPPMICSKLNIGETSTLPDESSVPAGYARDKVVAETLRLLNKDAPVLARMETIRRSLIIGKNERGVLPELVGALQARVLDGESRGKGDALAWFDAAYAAAAWSDMDSGRAPAVGLAEGCVGYAWMRKAMALGKDPAEMEFAAALVTHPAMHKGTYELHQRHLSKAAAGAAGGSLLEQNLQEYCRNWKESYTDLKEKGGARRDADRNR